MLEEKLAKRERGRGNGMEQTDGRERREIDETVARQIAKASHKVTQTARAHFEVSRKTLESFTANEEIARRVKNPSSPNCGHVPKLDPDGTS